MTMESNRRSFLSSALAGVGVLSLGGKLTDMASASPFHRGFSVGKVSELLPPNELGLRLPKGYTARIVAEATKPVALAFNEVSRYEWHKFPDGGACYGLDDGGWVYVSNSEVPFYLGGAGALRFNAEGDLIDSYSILKGTTSNCAGGATPWKTWLSCEEVAFGRVFECDIFGEREAQACPGLGYFKHEAAAVDYEKRRVYLTEDEKDGCFYRYTATKMLGDRLDLESGFLEVASVASDGRVIWIPLPNPNPKWYEKPTRNQVQEATRFNGGEGIWCHEGHVIFTTKGDNRVWDFDVNQSRLKVLYDAKTATNPILTGVDNVCISPSGDIYVAEDGGDMQIVVLSHDGAMLPIVQVMGQNSSEITGPAISPRGDKLYFSSQRANGNGVTYEISGRFFEV